MSTLDQIKQLNSEIEAICRRIEIQSSNIMDIELLKKKTIDLYEHILLLQDTKIFEKPAIDLTKEEKAVESAFIQETQKTDIQPEITEVSVEEAVVSTEEKPLAIAEEVAKSTSEDENIKEPTLAEYIEKEKAELVRKTEILIEETPVQEITEEEREVKTSFSEELYQAAQEQLSKKSVYEKFTRNKPSINEKMASAKDAVPFADSVAKGPITDIPKAISLNLKLSFIKELYNGDQKEYNRLISFLTKCQNYSEAKLYIQEEKDKYPAWESKSELVDQLMSLITRRFRL